MSDSSNDLLRSFIRGHIMTMYEGAWEDPDVVLAKKDVSVEDIDDEDDEDPDAIKSMQKNSTQGFDLTSRDTYGRSNTRMASMKPRGPNMPGAGAQSGRTPGGTTAPVSRAYSAGY